MMLHKTESESKNNDSAGNSNHGQLLRDIEEISKALYLHKSPQKVLLSPSDVRSKSAGKTRFSDSPSKSSSNPSFLREDFWHKERKSSSIWNWKKPLKALTHIGNRKFNCCFYLHVHSLEGLPASFNNLSLCVHWKRKDEVLKTQYSRVVEGIAEFDETLMHRCSVYGSRNGPNHSCKYEEKLFLIYVSVSGAPGLDIGKHWVDLTRLLPLTAEELEGEKSNGKWTTSFNLSGKARGANLNASLGFLVMQDKFVNLSANPNVPELINTVQKGSSTSDNGARMLQRVGSVPSNVNSRPAFSSQSLDLKICSEVLLTGGLELSKSINFLYQTLDEGKLCNALESDSEHVVPLKPKPDLGPLSSKGIEEYEDYSVEFTILEVGTEMSEKEQLKSDKVAGHANDDSAIEIVFVDEIIKDCDIDLDERIMVIPKDACGNYLNEGMLDDSKHEKDSICTKGSTTDEVESASHLPLISESAELDPRFTSGEFLEERNHMELNSSYRASETGKKSLSFDDVTESVSSDFLNILGMDCCMSSDSDPESPRGRLLREFEKETLASGNLLFDFDWKEEQPEIGSVSRDSDCGDYFESSDLSLFIQAAEEEHMRTSELLKRRKAKFLEDLETEALMREWGLNEKDFQNSPHTRSGGFGSPIELPLEEPFLPPLEEGFGPCVRMKGGGFLSSMNPSLFRNAKNGANLVIQISKQVVIPAKMGYDVMEILQNLALVGIDKLHVRVNKQMPLEDITGKTIQEVAWEAVPSITESERFEHILYGEGNKEGFPSSWNCNNLRSEFIGCEMGSDYVSLETLVPLAMDKIEALSLEGLRIQSHMSDGKAPSSIYPRSGGKLSTFERESANRGEILRLGVEGLQLWDFRDCDADADGLMALCLSLEEWLSLDAKIIGDEDHSREQILKILAAHDAKCTDLVGGRLTQDINCRDLSGRNCGFLGNNLTIALMVQLRDPFRNYEPVGAPMLALIQVERVVAHLMQKVPSAVLNDRKEEEHDEPVLEETDDKEKGKSNEGDEEGSPQFKIIDIHLAGVDTEPGNWQLWGTTTQLQSGSRWLLASGMGKTFSFSLPNSNAIVRSSPLVSAKMQHRDSLWSISSHVQGMGATWKDLIAPHIRNPNVIFPDETIKASRNM